MLTSLLTGIPYSFTAHAADLFKHNLFLNEKINLSKFVVTISNFNKEYILKEVGNSQNSKKIHVIHCGIDLNKFVLAGSKLVEQETSFNILTIGRFIEKKGHLYLLEALSMLKKRGYGFKWIVVGEGPTKSLIQKRAKELRLNNYIEFPGEVSQEEITTYYSLAHIFVLPCIQGKDNDMDGIPVVLMEAMAMSIPVISSAISGIPELIHDGRNGFLANPADPRSLLNAIQRIFKRPEIIPVFKQEARKTIEKDYDIHKNVERLSFLFRQNPKSKNFE
jgi:glycosyltransferase involved in cell wall biosynthesis